MRYDYGGLSKEGVDCSGFVYLTYLSNFGIELPRTAAQQSREGRPIAPRQLQAGDLVFLKRVGSLGMWEFLWKIGNSFTHRRVMG